MTRKAMNHWAGTAQDLAQCYPASDANGADGYIRISRNNQVVYMHRWIWEQMMGPIPTDYEIDHINGIRTDNRIDNLRCIPQAAQKRNLKKRDDNTSGVLGVTRWTTKRRGDQVVEMWRAVATNPQGKQVIKTFSIKKYGEDEAFRLACAAREQMSKDFNYHPNHGR